MLSRTEGIGKIMADGESDGKDAGASAGNALVDSLIPSPFTGVEAGEAPPPSFVFVEASMLRLEPADGGTRS
jgi:hypothetical protein